MRRYQIQYFVLVAAEPVELHLYVAAAVASECFEPPELGRTAEFHLLVVFAGLASGVAEIGFGSDSVEAAHEPSSSVVVPQSWIVAAAVGIDAQG